MNKAVREAVQGRDTAGTDENVEISRSVPPIARHPAARAVLVSPRSAVWDHPAASPDAIDPLAAIRDPVWNDRNGTAWTPDLVHCRLLDTAATVARLPSASMRSYASILGQVADREPDEARPGPPSAAEITLADWTWSELLARPPLQRAILIGMAFELSAQKIADTIARIGLARKSTHKSTVQQWYLKDRRYLAGRWQSAKHPVDASSLGRCRGLFARNEIK